LVKGTSPSRERTKTTNQSEWPAPLGFFCGGGVARNKNGRSKRQKEKKKGGTGPTLTQYNISRKIPTFPRTEAL